MKIRLEILARACAVAAAFAVSPCAFAAGPVEELYGKHLTVMCDFDGGTADSSVNGLKPRSPTWACGAGGLFGSKGLVSGQFSFTNAKLPNGRTAMDTTHPGTMVFWLKLAQDLDPEMKYDPGCTHFCAMWGPDKRFLVFRQDGKSCGAGGASSLSAYMHAKTPAGKQVVFRAYGGPSFRKLKKDEWHLVVATWSPDGIAFSYDGAPFQTAVATEPLGPGVWLLSFANYGGPDKTPGYCVMDDCAILDFALTDGQVKGLWDEYQARFKETPGADDVRVTLEKCGEKDASRFEIVLKAKNEGKAPAKLVFAAKATPETSQPAATREAFTLKPGEERTIRFEGPALGEESVTADFGIASADKSRTYFRRHRVFAPRAPEPEWMRAPSAVSFKFAYYPSENTIHASANVSGCEDFAKLTGLKLAVFRKGGKKPVAEKTFTPGANGLTEFFWRGLPELDGEYVCRLTGVGLGGVTASQAFLRKRFEWEGNKYGLSDAVPAPFKPVKSEKGKVKNEEVVSVVLRAHTVDKTTGLWKQVNAAGKDILARPVQIVSSGSTPTPSTYTSSTEWDVDGLMEWRLTLKPGHYEPMALEIPMKGEVAWLYHAAADGLRMNKGGRIPAGEGRVWDSIKTPRNQIVGSYVPYVWIGGTLRGISVFGENDKGWILRGDGVSPSQKGHDGEDAVATQKKGHDGEDAVATHEIVREADGTVVLKLNLIQKACDIAEARTIRLGFMATPVKPMPENWRALGHGHLMGSCWCWGGEDPCCSIEPYDGTDEYFRKMGEARKAGKFDQAYLDRFLAGYPYRHKEGTPEAKQERQTMLNHYRYGLFHAAEAKGTGRLTFYTNARGVQYGDPKGQGATFCNEWNRFEYFTRDITRTLSRAYDLEPVASYRDYAAWWYRKMVETGACNHLYWDDVYLTPVFNLVQTDAYRMPNGQIQPATGVFNMRAMIRRAAVVQAELGKDPSGNWVHMTNTAIAPICSFAGVNYDWEDTSGENPMQVKYPRDYILACSLGRQFGNRVGIMGYFHPKSKEQGRWLHRTGAGVMLTHEFRWNLWSGHDEYYKYHDLLCNWGYRTPEVDVWNYWDEDVRYPLAVSGVENASIAMAKKAVHEAYVCVSSFSSADGAVTVTPDAATLGLNPGWTATDAETGKEIAVANGSFRLEIPKYYWKLVLLK